jgi:hypothetical protein
MPLRRVHDTVGQEPPWWRAVSAIGHQHVVEILCGAAVLFFAPCYSSFGRGLPGRALTSQHPTDEVINRMRRGS